jgi:chemotaxis protein MotB
MLTVFAVVQFFLSQEVTGKDTALLRLSARIAQLSELLSLEQNTKVSLEEQLAQLRASLATSEGSATATRALRGARRQPAGPDVDLNSQLDAEKRVARALAQSRC